jgi:hypothetical protein
MPTCADGMPRLPTVSHTPRKVIELSRWHSTEVPKLVGNRRWLNVLADKCITLDSVQVNLAAG